MQVELADNRIDVICDAEELKIERILKGILLFSQVSPKKFQQKLAECSERTNEV